MLLISTLAWSQAAPPRTITDISELLEQYKPDFSATTAARAILERTPPQGASEEALVRFLLERIAAAAMLGDQPERLKAAREAGTHLSARQFARRVLNEWANAEGDSGYVLEAIRIRELSSSQYRAVSGNQMSNNATLAALYADQGNLAAGKKLLADSEAIYRQISSAKWWVENLKALIEGQRGDLFAREGSYAEAEAAYRRAFAAAHNDVDINLQRLAAGVDSPSQNIVVGMRANNGRKLASMLLSMGHMAEAEVFARDLLRHALEWSGPSHPGTARALGLLSNVLLAQGRFNDAEVLARAALTSMTGSGIGGASMSLAGARGRVAGTLVAQQRWQDALAEFDRRRQGLENDPELARFLESDSLNLGIALYQMRHFEQAAVIFERRHRWWLENFGPSHRQTATMLAFGALSRAGLGHKEQALKDLADALAVLIAGARNAQSTNQGGFVGALRFKWIAEGYLRLLTEIHAAHQAPEGFDPVSEAFRIADAARGSRVQVALSASSARAAIRDPELAKLAREAQDGSQRVNSLNAILLDLLSRRPDQQLPQVVAEMRRDIEKLQMRRGELGAEIERRFPEYTSLVDPRPVSLEAARKSLRPGESLIALFCTEDQTFVWAVPHTGAMAFAAVALGAIERSDIVRKLRRSLDSESGILLREIPAFDVALAHQLYTKLLVPVQVGWKDASSLIVVPHGGLGQLPFAVLPTEPSTATHEPERFESYRQVAWLSRKVSLTQLPSVTSLVTLRATKVERAPARTFAGFGDPIFGKTTPQSAALAAATTRGITTRSVYLASRGGAKQLDSAQLAQLPQLPDTAEEVREIAKALQAEEAKDVFLGAQASEKRVKSMDLSDRRVLLFATHGLIPGDLDGLTQPALALTNPAITGDKDDDGLLAVDEIVGLRLNADLVVLSACNTASGDGDGAEAVSGLGRAFFYAGARALLVSNWPVESVSARMLTTDLFARVVKEPQLAPAEALRRSMLGLIDQGTGKAGDTAFSYAHPTFWAPFTLVGDGQGR
jgi:CHAT domain-containing protein